MGADRRALRRGDAASDRRRRPPHAGSPHAGSGTTARRLICAAAAGVACRAGVARPPNADPPGAARVVFADEFSGPALDRGRWTVRVTGPAHRTVNDEQQAYVDDPATVRVVHGAEAAGAEGGALRIGALARAVTANGTRFDFVSGRLDTRGTVEFTYGTAAARMKLPAGAGLWPAFWVLGTGDWPATGEIDVMENVGDPAG